MGVVVTHIGQTILHDYINKPAEYYIKKHQMILIGKTQ